MTIEEILNKQINELLMMFKSHPGVFLTEDDVRNHLSHLLFPFFNKVITSKDGKTSMPLHSEVRWYGKEQDRHERSDLVLIDVKDLRVDSYGRFLLPSKGYGFNNFYAAIEIKLRRGKYSPNNNRWLSMLENDVEKLKFLENGVQNKYNPLLYLIALDKKEDISNELKRTTNSGVVKVFYKYGR